MRSSVRDHKGVVHSLNYVAEVDGTNASLWTSVLEAKHLARRTHRTFQALAMCDAKVKIHARTVSRLNNDPQTCLFCMMEEQRDETT